MTEEQYLMLGPMPRVAKAATHRAAGPWCFVGLEEFFPNWEEDFSFAPEPLRDRDALAVAAAQAQRLVARNIAPLAVHVRPKGSPLPTAYWDMVFGAWLIMVTQQVVDRWLRVQAMVELWGQEPLTVEILPSDCTFTFGDDHDFVLGGCLGQTYNHWLMSRLLEPVWPAAWKKVVLSPVHERQCAADTPLRWKEKAKELARQMVLRWPFPAVKGFGLRHMLRFSWALRGNTGTEDRSRSLAALDVPYAQVPDEHLPCDILPLLYASLPQGIRNARHPAALTPAVRVRTRVANVSALEDTPYRMLLARWRGMGHKLVFIQHGGNYGHVRTSSVDPVVEYCQHAFITWGWTKQSPCTGNFIPLPHAQLAALRDKHTNTSDQLLFVGSELTVFPYRMDSRLTPCQVLQYRDDKQWFFEALPRAVQKQCQYRPYFSVPGALTDAEWLLPRFPLVHLCSGPLDAHMLSCRLLVLDHHGTTLELGMAANVPMVMFWDRQAWGLCPETETALDDLAAVGIWQPTAESAAMHILHIWDDIPGWWNSEAVQAARQRWMRQYALTVPDSIEPYWIKALTSL
ncbi:MAG: LIC12162 family protein [Desulfovibrionaceae bacterium]